MNELTAKDLMVGDWVQHFSGNYFRVTRIDKWGDGSAHFACGHPHLWDYNNKFSHIPLNAEILEKNGFWCEHDVGYVTEEYEYEIIYSTWNHELRILKNREQILKLKYFDEMCVHELQHALRLAGIEKTIEL